MSFEYQSKSGQILEFREYNFYGTWNHAVGGLYIFAKRHRITANWVFLYIGKTDSFARRMNEHQRDKWPDAVNLGAHVVLAVVIQSEYERLRLEKELIHQYCPTLNTVDNPSKSQQTGLGLASLMSNHNAHQPRLIDLTSTTNPSIAPQSGLLSIASETNTTQLGMLGTYINRN